ncbi:MAG: tRNA (guanine(46)-N(7))-methyltransferase TrmB [Candidatus Falkowbacteria bacterium]
MMPKNKLKKFAELKTFSNVLQSTKPQIIDWQKHFGNNNPITLELACGKGDYTLGLARLYPDRNFIGIDIKGARIWRGAKTALEEKLTNVAFLRAQIQFLDKYFIANNITKSSPLLKRGGGQGVVMKNLGAQDILSTKKLTQKSQHIITDIWITFPDPFPRKRDIKRRLTSLRFLKIYKKILTPHGLLHLKTDDLNLFEYSLETAIAENWEIKKSINNLYASLSFRAKRSGDPESRKKIINPITDIQTFDLS